MAKARLSLVMLASIMCVLLSLPAEAQTGVRAVHFGGTACLYNTNVQSPFANAASGNISVWYAFQTIGPGTDQTIMSSNTNGTGATNVLDMHIENTVAATRLSTG